MTLVYSEHAYIATNPTVFTPASAPVAGRLLVISAHTRAASDKLLAITGWTIIGSAAESVGANPDVGLSMFYRVAVTGDTGWSIAATQCDIAYSEWADFGALLTSASATVNASTSPAAIACGGPVTPVSAAEVLIIGAMSAGMENDTAVMASVPSADIIELDDKAGASNNPGRWSGYRIVAVPSGAYTIGATATFTGATIDQVGITAAFAAAVADPTPGVWMDWDGDGFDALTTSDPDAPLARMMPEAGPAGVSDNVTDRVLSMTWNRGGSYDHIGQDGPGGATITLRNDDGLFDPDNVSGALYGKLEPGIPVWAGAIRDTGALSGSGTVRGIFGGYVKTWSPTVDGSGARIVEVICEDALGRYAVTPVTVEPSLTRSHADLRLAVLEAAGEDAARLDTEGEPGMLPFSAIDSTSALAVLEELNQATASRHFVTPGDTKEDWYAYTVVNKYHGLADAVAETINGDDITDVSGWVVTNENRIEQQRAEVQPVSLTSNNNVVWQSEQIPVNVDFRRAQTIWATFDDYVFEASLNIALSSGGASTTITTFGKTAKIVIWGSTIHSVNTVSQLQVLGRQVERGDAEQVTAGSTDPGARAGSTITSDLIGSLGAAQGLCDFIIWKFGNRLKRPSFSIGSKSVATHNTIADRDLYDVVGVVVDKLSVTTRRLEIIGLSGSVVPGRYYSVNYQTQETPNQSAVHWFTVGTDTVGGGVPLAPF